MNRDLVDDSSPSAARDATDFSGDEQEKPPLRAYIPSILVIVFGIVIVVGFFVTFHARASEAEDYWQERRDQQAEVVQRFEEQYGVSIDDPGSYSTDVSEWVIDGEARTWRRL
jgi:hypothetical protein